jgi:hypothetical protein
MEMVGIFFGHFEYIRPILCPSCNLVAIWYIFPRFGTLCRERSGNRATDPLGVLTL